MQKKSDENRLNLDKEQFKHKVSIDYDNVSMESKKLDIEKSKLSTQKKIDSRKLELEERKLENQNLIEEKRLELEKWKLEIETRRLELENQKLIKEEEAKLAEAQKSKWDRIVNTGLRVLEIGAPLAINTILVLMSLKLVYVDDGRVPSEMKDLMKNIYRGR